MSGPPPDLPGLFDGRSAECQRELASHLEPVSLGDGEPVFLEGSAGNALYFIAEGRVRVTKRLAGGGDKELAILGPGDCLGEMALLENVPRSASAHAAGPITLLRLSLDHLRGWLSRDPARALDFFGELVQAQSRRLRRTSSELAMLYDLSRLLLEPHPSPRALLSRALERVLPHLDGDWSADARLHNPFNGEMDPAPSAGPEDFGPAPVPVPGPEAPEAAWSDARTLTLVLRGSRRPLAVLRWRRREPPSEALRLEAERALAAAGRLLAAALENIDLRTDEALRARLRSRSDGQEL